MLAPTPFFADRGCHVRIYEEARLLRELGHEVLIATYHLGRDVGGIPTRRVPSVPWYRKLSAGPSWHKPYLDILLFFTAFRAARTFRPQVIHAHLHEGAFVGMFLSMLLGLPLVFDCQGSLTTEMLDHRFMTRGGIVHRVFRFLERIINSAAGHVITSSRAGADDLRQNWELPDSRVSPVIDGVDTEVFTPRDRAEARRVLGLPAEATVAAFLGVLNSYQGVDILLESARILKEQGHPIHFLVMGFPEEKYREKAREMGLADLFTFTGRVDYAQAPLYLSAADIALSPKVSLTEANGKLFNYMACALPTVCFDNPINREILADTGIYARHGDAADFAAKVRDLAADVSLRADLSARVRRRAVEVHSWKARANALLSAYEKATASRTS
ncbi:MAG TPA: glycosyltransferase family 4 protein [Verrucomicrobiae bacterium]|nr:glycosyltransferase family 4 protein [Verrucomicrobiae bacterium]